MRGGSWWRLRVEFQARSLGKCSRIWRFCQPTWFQFWGFIGARLLVKFSNFELTKQIHKVPFAPHLVHLSCKNFKHTTAKPESAFYLNSLYGHSQSAISITQHQTRFHSLPQSVVSDFESLFILTKSRRVDPAINRAPLRCPKYC